MINDDENVYDVFVAYVNEHKDELTPREVLTKEQFKDLCIPPPRTGGNHSTRRHSRVSRPNPRKTWRMY